METLEKSWNFKMVVSRPGKVMEMCYNHMVIDAEFEIINVFFKERRSKYKPAYALNTQHYRRFSCLYRDFSLVMEIWFKVLEIHWSTCVRARSLPFAHVGSRMVIECSIY